MLTLTVDCDCCGEEIARLEVLVPVREAYQTLRGASDLIPFHPADPARCAPCLAAAGYPPASLRPRGAHVPLTDIIKD